MRQVFGKMRDKPYLNDGAALSPRTSFWRIALSAGIGACLLSAVSCSIAGDSHQPDAIVYQYFASTQEALGHMKHIRNFKGIKGDLVEEIYRKPPGTPGSLNSLRTVGGDDVAGNEVVNLSVLDGSGKLLFETHQFQRWSTRSSRIKDYYYIFQEPVPHEAVIAMRGDNWETVRDDARADDHDYPYEIVEISSSGVERFDCVFDKVVLTSGAHRKVLTAIVGRNRPEDALDMIAKWLSEHGARNQADHCRRKEGPEI